MKFHEWDKVVVVIMFHYQEVTGIFDQSYRNIQYLL